MCELATGRRRSEEAGERTTRTTAGDEVAWTIPGVTVTIEVTVAGVTVYWKNDAQSAERLASDGVLTALPVTARAQLSSMKC